MTIFPKLKFLHYHSSNICFQYISFQELPTSLFSSTLLELHIRVCTIGDCLHLLDGGFNQLRVFKITIESSIRSISRQSKVDSEIFEEKNHFYFS